MNKLSFLRTATVLGGISLALLSGCVILVPEDTPAPEAESCQPAGLDLDADCVSDTFDNCPDIENAEQLAQMVRARLTEPTGITLYLIGVAAVGLHVSHAVQSALHTLGLHHSRYVALVRNTSIGLALVFSIVTILAGLCIEHNRTRPLLITRWLGSGRMIRFALGVLLTRIVLSEQATGAVGFLQGLNQGTQQLHTLYFFMLLGSVAGLAVSALTINPQHLFKPLIISLALMAIGSTMDSFSTSLTRGPQMYFSQFLLAFGGTFFLGPTLVLGISGVISNPRNMVSFSVLFGITQNVGSLIGSALLGTFQVWREKFHSAHIVEHVTLLDPQVQSRLQSSSGAYLSAIADPSARTHQGIRALATAATREANTLAYNDVFMLIALIAVLTAIWITSRATWLWITTEPVAPFTPATPGASPVQPSGTPSS